MSARYEIRLSCPDDRSPEDISEGLKVTVDGDVVLITGRLDQSALHGLLERARNKQWRLLDVRRARSLPRTQG